MFAAFVFVQQKEINDIKLLLRVLKMYIPLPVFWALFHQQVKRVYLLGQCCINVTATWTVTQHVSLLEERGTIVTAQLTVTKGNKN